MYPFFSLLQKPWVGFIFLVEKTPPCPPSDQSLVFSWYSFPDPFRTLDILKQRNREKGWGEHGCRTTKTNEKSPETWRESPKKKRGFPFRVFFSFYFLLTLSHQLLFPAFQTFVSSMPTAFVVSNGSCFLSFAEGRKVAWLWFRIYTRNPTPCFHVGSGEWKRPFEKHVIIQNTNSVGNTRHQIDPSEAKEAERGKAV